MFIHLQRYWFEKKYLSAWKRITKLSNAIYAEHEDIRFERLISRRQEVVSVVELAFYSSKKQFLHANKKINTDERIGKLRQLLLRFVPKRRIIEEIYESL